MTPSDDVQPPEGGSAPTPTAASEAAPASPAAGQPFGAGASPEPSSTPSVAAAMIEAITLREASARSARLPPELRDGLRHEIALGAQRRDAAEVLARNGHPAEAWRLAREAFCAGQGAAERLVAAEARAVRFPGGLGLGRGDGRLVERVAAAARTTLPASDDAFRPEHEQALAELLDASARLGRRLGQLTATPRELLLLRARRGLGLLVVGAACLAAIAWLVVPRREVHATGSAWWGNLDEEHPRNAIDADESTEWNLPDRTLGFLELRPSPARNLRAVRVLDIRNPPWHDRGTATFRVTAFSGGRAVATGEGRFPPELGAHWVEVPLDARDVERVRIDILSHQLQGAGLAEVVLLER